MFEGLPYRHFNVIAADVPWGYVTRSEAGITERSPEHHYDTMSLTDIARLPVEAYAAPDSHLLFWVTGPFMAIGAHMPIMRAWGYEPTAIWGVWFKPTWEAWEQRFFVDIHDESLWKMGMGHTTRQNAEYVVLGRRGSPERLSKSVRQIITEPVEMFDMVSPLREHSRKPEKFYSNAEKYAAGPRLELFGRQQRPGWTVRGNQENKFDSTSRVSDG